MSTSELSTGDLALLVQLASASSLRALAATQGQNVSTLSRRLQRLERHFGVRLITRSSLGIAATTEARELAMRAQPLLAAFEQLAAHAPQATAGPYLRHVAIGSRGYLNTFLAPHLCRENESSAAPGSRGFRFVDLSPDEAQRAARAGMVDILLSPDDLPVGKAWQGQRVGTLRWGIYANPRHAWFGVGPRPNLAAMRVGHHCFFDGQSLRTSDGLLFRSQRIRQVGHGAQTAATALAIAEATDELACVPAIVAREAVRLGRLRELTLPTLKITTPLTLHAHIDRLAASEVKWLIGVIRAALR